jgi:hypothetical protein
MPTAVLETKSNGPKRALCLVHLVRAANGTGPLASFLASYRKHPAGTEHDLVLLLKGFSSPEQAEPHLELARDLSTEHQFVGDDTLDLGAYLAAAQRLQRERYCFVNSFSVILADDWLAMLDRALTRPGVGMVGATGSWASPRSQALRQARWAPRSAYDDVFPDRRWMVEHFETLRAEQAGDADVRLAELRLRINRWRSLLQVLRGFGPFPSVHLRTNAFAIEARTLERLALGSAGRKVDTYRLESGKRGITRQVRELGLHAQVVDRGGAAFEPADWHLSRTFWQGDQERLLVADNQTRSYADGDLDRRTLLAGLAWGRLADVTAASARDGQRAPA